MSLNDDSIKEVALTLFKGSDNTSDPYNVDPAHLIYAQNLDFTVAENGMVQAGTRTGTTSFGGGNLAKVTSMASWVFVSGGVETGWVVLFDLNSNNVFAWKQNSSTFTGLLVSAFATTIAANFAFEGARMYVAFQNNVIAGPGDKAASVFGFTPNVSEPLFLSGLTTASATVTTGTPAAGVITVGSHRIGFIFTTNNGYTGVLNPVAGSGTNPNSWTPTLVVQGIANQNIVVQINWIVNPTTLFPSGGTVQVVMTPASNPNKVLTVPNAVATIPNAISTTTITISITDADLIASGTDVTQNQNLLAANPNTGVAPFKPSAIFQYSARMGYCTYDSAGFPVAYFSDQNAYQSLTAAFHGVYIEGRQIPIQGASLGGVCYIATLSGLYATQDNGGLPSTWIPPARVDGSVGILSSSCMSASTQVQGTATGRIILASEKGLFIFKGGTFPEIPLSYWQTTDWNRINWAAPWQLQIVDDVYRQKIRVLAPLKSNIVSATNANPIVVTTSLPHLIPSVSGTSAIQVVISGAVGNTNVNGTFATVTVISPTSFSVAATGNGTYAGSGVVTPSSANAEMDWTYPEGDEPGQPYYSLNSWSSYAPGSIAIIRNLTTQIDETWYGPFASSNSVFQRRVVASTQDPLQFRDQDLQGNAIGIPSILETSLLPNSADIQKTLHDYHGAHFRLTGNGLVNVAAFSADHTLSVVPAASPLSMSLNPGQEILMKWFLRNEQQSIQLSTTGLAGDTFFVLSRLKAYYTDSLPIR